MTLYRWHYLLPFTLFSFLAPIALASPYATRIQNLAAFERAGVGDAFHVSVSTSEGMHRFVMKRVAPYASDCAVNGVLLSPKDCVPKGFKLFRGRLRAGAGLLPVISGVSADIIDGKLRIHFSGRRGRRAYTAETLLDTNNSSTVQALRHRPAKVAYNFCGTSGAIDPNKYGASLTASAGLPAPLAATGSNGNIEITTDADAELFAVYGANTNAQIQTILNSTEAIYLSQLGLGFDLNFQNVFSDAAAQPYTSSDSVTLLDQFQDYTEANRHLGPGDTHHLFTGKDLEDNRLGLAFTGVICETPSSTYGLTQSSSAQLDPLIFAHELGHNFNASHDDSSTGIMNTAIDPSLIGTDPNISLFSAFSLNEINSHIASNEACLGAEALPFTNRPAFSKLTLSNKGKLTLNVGEPGDTTCDLTVLLLDGNTTFTLKTFTVKAKESGKLLKLTASGVKVNGTAVPQITLRIKKECDGFDTAFSADGAGVVSAPSTSGTLATAQDVANQIFRTLKRAPKKKK